MPELINPDVAPKTGSWFSEYLEKQASWPMDIDMRVTELIKFLGAKSTLKEIKRANKATLSSVTGGVIETQPTGRFEAALETEDGSMFISGQCRADYIYSDPQVSESGLRVSGVDALGAHWGVPDFVGKRKDGIIERVPAGKPVFLGDRPWKG